MAGAEQSAFDSTDILALDHHINGMYISLLTGFSPGAFKLHTCSSSVSFSVLSSSLSGIKQLSHILLIF